MSKVQSYAESLKLKQELEEKMYNQQRKLLREKVTYFDSFSFSSSIMRKFRPKTVQAKFQWFMKYYEGKMQAFIIFFWRHYELPIEKTWI